MQGLRCLLREPRSLLYRSNSLLNQERSILCRFLGFLSQISHLIGNYRKAFSRFSRSCRLNRCIQGKNIGLESNVVNGLNNLTDFLGFFRNLFHGALHIRHFLITGFHMRSAEYSKFLSLLRLLCRMADLLRNALHGIG